jgi:hypothetical protein
LYCNRRGYHVWIYIPEALDIPERRSAQSSDRIICFSGDGGGYPKQHFDLFLYKNIIVAAGGIKSGTDRTGIYLELFFLPVGSISGSGTGGQLKAKPFCRKCAEGY